MKIFVSTKYLNRGYFINDDGTPDGFIEYGVGQGKPTKEQQTKVILYMKLCQMQNDAFWENVVKKEDHVEFDALEEILQGFEEREKSWLK